MTRRLTLRDWSASILGLAASLVPQIALAQSPDAALSLTYTAPPGCGSKIQVLRQLERALGPDSDTQGWSANIAVQRTAKDDLLLHFDATKAEIHGERSLHVDSCRAAVEASSLLLLLTIDPLRAAEVAQDPQASRVLTTPETEPLEAESTPTLAATPSPSTPAEATASDAPPTRRTPVEDAGARQGGTLGHSVLAPTRYWLGAAALWHSGELVDPGMGALVEVGGEWSRLALAVGAAWLPLQEAGIADDGAQVATAAVEAQLVGMYRLGTGPIRYGPFAGVGIRFIRAEARNITSPGSAGYTGWSALLAGLRASANFSQSFSLFASAGAALALARPEIRVVGPGVVHQPDQLGLEGFVGVSWSSGSQ